MMRPWLLAGGMLFGAALAVFYIVRVPDAPPPTADAVAWVNGRPIARESYERALEAVATERNGGALREGARERSLDRRLDQELVIERACDAAARFRFARSTQYRVSAEGAAVPSPDGFLLEKEIAQRLGPTAARRVGALQVGEAFALADPELTVRLLERRGGAVAPFDEARDAVEAA